MSATSRPIAHLGCYQLDQLIGEGGFGRVYRGRDLRNGQTIAVKVLPESAANDRVLMSRFEREFRSARTLNHPNIVMAHDFVSTGTPYLVMEFVPGESLGDRLNRSGAVPELEAVRLIIDICRTLHFAHQHGVIHRDVKPDNILVTADGQIKITDFGLSKELFAEYQLTRPGQGLGTPYYMAPEQFRSAMHADARSDVYGVAATLYHMLTGQPPFADVKLRDMLSMKIRGQINHPRTLNRRISKKLERVILKGLRVDPSQRHASLADFERELPDEDAVLASDVSDDPNSRPRWAVSANPRRNPTRSATSASLINWKMILIFLICMLATWGLSALLM